MDDKLKHLLQAQVEREAGGRGASNVGQVMEKGRHKKILTQLSVGSGVMLLAAAITWTAVANPFAEDPPTPIVGPGPVQPQEGRVLYEEVPEQTRAEIFAFRALANNDLMDPLGARSYNWTYEEDTTETEGGWRVGFAASDCEPKNNSHTCTGLSGEEPAQGNAVTDTYLHVMVEEGTWRVLRVEGNMLPEEQERVVGYSLPDEREPSHWDFASTAVRQGRPDDLTSALTPIWVGPYPTKAPGSVCEITGVDAAGRPVGEASVFYEEPPNRPFSRAGWVRAGGAQLPEEAVDAEVSCEQYTGPGWQLASEPEIVGEPGAVMGITADLEWKGPDGFTSPASCTATLVGESGETVWEGSGRLEQLRNPDELERSHYREKVFVPTQGEEIDAEGVGEFSCRSL